MKIKVASRLGSVEEYYFSTKLKEIREMNNRGADVINLGIGSPDMAPPAAIVDTLNQTSQKPNVHGYQGYSGIPELRSAIADWYRKFYKTELDPNSEVLPLIGSKEGIMHISMTYLEKGDIVLVPNPGYPAYQAAANIAEAKTRYYDLTAEQNWMPDFQALEKLDLSNVKIMWVNYPNMPTGKPATLALFQKLIDFGRKHNILIINDNPYSFVLNDDPISILSIPDSKEVALELNSLSKAHNMAGWRVGMLVGDQDRIKDVLRFKSNMDSGMFRGIQEAAITALGLDNDWFDQLNSIYGKRRQLAYSILDLLGCHYDTTHQGLFVWAKIPDVYKDGYELSDRCLYDANVFITPGGIFGSNGNEYVRVSLCANVDQLEQATKRLVKANVTLENIKL